jgi:glyoxylase-like metal-dependent hydrolase (beta-lactamase superfamily II)
MISEGHTPGRVVLFETGERMAFVGDCLFAGSIVRTDLLGGCDEQLMDSLTNKIVARGRPTRSSRARTRRGRQS